MNTVQEIEAAMPKLSRAEIERIRAWIDDFLENQLELTDEIKAKLDQSRQEIAEGRYTTRQREMGTPMDSLVADTWEKLGTAPEVDDDRV